MPGKSARVLRPVLLAALFGMALSTASAQEYNPYPGAIPYGSAPPETVTVLAPHFKADSTKLNGPLERVSLAQPIHYDIGDLLDPERSQALRWRVWRAAHEVCDRLRDAYPVYRMSTAPSCFREAYNNAIVKIDARITGARLAYWYGY